jgi:hypothetical protein
VKPNFDRSNRDRIRRGLKHDFSPKSQKHKENLKGKFEEDPDGTSKILSKKT